MRHIPLVFHVSALLIILFALFSGAYAILNQAVVKASSVSIGSTSDGSVTNAHFSSTDRFASSRADSDELALENDWLQRTALLACPFH